jgi:hypothetical protein
MMELGWGVGVQLSISLWSKRMQNTTLKYTYHSEDTTLQGLCFTFIYLLDVCPSNVMI